MTHTILNRSLARTDAPSGPRRARRVSSLRRAKTREAQRETPPIGQFLTVDGVRLQYVERGRGEPLVLIHGNGMMIQDFLVSGIVDDLTERYASSSSTRPGYGYSDRPRGLWTPRALTPHCSRRHFSNLVSRKRSCSDTRGERWSRSPSRSRLRNSSAASSWPPGIITDVTCRRAAGVARGDPRHRRPDAPHRIARARTAHAAALIKAMFAPAAVTDRFDRAFPKAMMLRPLQLRAFLRRCRPDDAGDGRT